MKRILALLAILQVCLASSAQTYSVPFEMALDTLCMSRFTAVYNYSIRTFDHNGNEVIDSILLGVQVGDGYWKCTPYLRVMNVREPKCRFDEVLETEALMHIETIVSGYPEGKITIHEAVAPYCYEVVEDKEAIAWTMNDKMETICNYACKGAIGEFRGKEWDVMYAEDIPTPVGPWKLHGLPGLIMSATDSEGIHSFTLVELYIESLPIIHENYFVLSIPTEGGGSRPTIKRYEKRTHEQMVTLRNKIFGAKVYPSNPQFSFPVFGASDVETTILNDDCLPNATLINGITILGKAHKFQPLELK